MSLRPESKFYGNVWFVYWIASRGKSSAVCVDRRVEPYVNRDSVSSCLGRSPQRRESESLSMSHLAARRIPVFYGGMRIGVISGFPVAMGPVNKSGGESSEPRQFRPT